MLLIRRVHQTQERKKRFVVVASIKAILTIAVQPLATTLYGIKLLLGATQGSASSGLLEIYLKVIIYL